MFILSKTWMTFNTAKLGKCLLMSKALKAVIWNENIKMKYK